MERIDDLQYENLKIIQDTDGFRFGIDSVLLTEFARDIKKGSKIIDLGSGTGIIGILLSKKVMPSKIVGIEKQKEVAEMSEKSIYLNKLNNLMEIKSIDIKDVNYPNGFFDVVITNPPYKKIGTGIDAKKDKQQISRFETTANLDDWIKCASKLLNNNSSFYMVYRTDRLTELISILKKYKLEIKRMRFVYSKITEQSKLVLIKAVKNAGVFLKVEKPLIIYNEDGTYTDEIKEVYKNKKIYK